MSEVSVDAVLDSLKGFQRRTVRYAFHQLYEAEQGTRRFLVADEVGLGKTLVASGLTAMAVAHLQEQGIKRVDVIYICSNQAIARQNVDRIKKTLNIPTEPLAERITLLPYRVSSLDHGVNLIALTPGTSFNRGNAEGVVEERVILWRMLNQAWGDLGPEARKVFQGTLRTVERFRDYEAEYVARPIEPTITRRFQEQVGTVGSPLHTEFVRVRDQLRTVGDDARGERRTFVAKLRRLLAKACLDALEPDLVVLDEFQRFRDLLDTDTDAGELAAQLFEYVGDGGEASAVRTVLLSATPYKMYTLSDEHDDDHYRDFLATIAFLRGSADATNELEDALATYRSELARSAQPGDAGKHALVRLHGARDRIERELRRVMSRTERRDHAIGADPMVNHMALSADVQTGDVEAFVHAKRVANLVDAPGVIEYWKSAPYLLSFLDRYQLSTRIRDAVERRETELLSREIRRGSGLQLRRKRLRRRQKVDAGNGRMRALQGDLGGSGLRRLLWLPPALPSYGLGEDYQRAAEQGATKRLVFSSWAMVPRAIAVMQSYDVEREFIPDPDHADEYRSSALTVSATAASLFALVYPSATLASLGDPLRYEATTPQQLLDEVAGVLSPRIEALTHAASADGPIQELWYAVAPLLLDVGTPDFDEWLNRLAEEEHGSGADAEEDARTGWSALLERVLAAVRSPATLGRPPADLVEALAALAVGSPSNATMRAVSHSTDAPMSDVEVRRQALRSGWTFRSLFRSPAAEGLLVRSYQPGISVGSGDYWRRILAYCIEGGLSDVLEEHAAVLADMQGGASSVAPEALGERMRAGPALATAPLEVTEWRTRGKSLQYKPFRMRQHFARRYASDAAQDDQQAGQHLDAVRAAFNSPFWPFVLATTSVGQEGLDFHWYCHGVVHWNLPSNPVDLEQREGRVNRYHGHAIRKNVAECVGQDALAITRERRRRGESSTLWAKAFALAEERFHDQDGLSPHWVLTSGKARIGRYVPLIPLSRDIAKLERLRRSLALYRMVFGQPRQDDLLEFILHQIPEERREELLEALYVDLAPPLLPTAPVFDTPLLVGPQNT